MIEGHFARAALRLIPPVELMPTDDSAEADEANEAVKLVGCAVAINGEVKRWHNNSDGLCGNEHTEAKGGESLKKVTCWIDETRLR